MCIFNCLLRLPVWIVVKSHWLQLHLFDFSPVCIFKCVFEYSMHFTMRSHTGNICLIYLHCVFSNEPLTRWPKWMHSYIGGSCLTFLHCGFSNESSNNLALRMHSYICCIYSAFLLTHWSHLLDFSPLCIFKCFFKLPASLDADAHKCNQCTLVTFVWLLSTVYF